MGARAIHPNSSNADMYIFESFKDNTRQFRLLKFLPSSTRSQLHVSLQTFHRREAPPYKALSYTWGAPKDEIQQRDQSPRLREILLNGRKFCTSENLHNALLELYSQEIGHVNLASSHFWIDAICVDQTNDVERSHQVNLMDAIYADAEYVIVWLGQETEDHNAFSKDLIKKTSALGTILVNDAKMAGTTGWTVWHKSDEKRAEYCSRVSLPPFTDGAWRCLLELFSRGWFSRLWVVQEAALAREIRVLCGSVQFSWADIEMTAEAFAAGLGSDISQVHFDPDARHQFSTANTCLLHICRTRRWCQTNVCPPAFDEYSILTGGNDNKPYPPAIILVVLRFFQVTDERDRVFGILGLVLYLSPNKENFLLADYTQTAIEIQRAASQRILQHNAWLGLLHFATNQTKRISDSNRMETTSWIIGSSPIRDAYFEKRFDPVRAGSLADWKTQPGFTFPDSRSVKTSGVKLCTVNAIGEPLRDFYDLSTSFTKTINMILAMEPIYKFTGQSRIEAAAEAMIESLITAPVLLAAFRNWWLYMLAKNTHASTSPLSKLFLKEIMMCEGLMTTNSTLDVVDNWRQGITSSELHANSEVYGRHFYLISFRRRFYTSIEGFIGVALEPLHPGDEIWLLPRTCSPFALRKVSDQTRGRTYSLIGPAFALGAMYGEMINDGNVWEDIILI